MSPDLTTRIRTYADTIESGAPPVTAGEAIERAGGAVIETIGRPEPKRRAWAVGLAAAVAACLLIGLPALFLLGGDGSPVTTPPAVTAPPSRGDPAWSPVPEPPDIGTLEKLWAAPDGSIFAYGDGEIWSSTEGDRWTPVGEVVLVLEATPSSPKLVSFGAGFVAVDTSFAFRDWWSLTPEQRSDVSPRLLASADGSEWTPIDLPVELPPGPPALQFEVVVEAVAAGPGGVVAVGRAHPHVDPMAVETAFPELGSVVRTDRLAPCCDGEPYQTDIADPVWVWTAGSEEPQAVSLAALGLTTEDLWRGPTPAWFSADGTTFEAVESDVEAVEVTLLATADGFTVFDLLDQRTWTSPDGLVWSETAPLPDGCVEPAAWKTGLVCLAETPTGTGVLHRQPDGSWTVLARAQALGLPEGASPEGLTAGDGGLALVASVEEVQPWSGEEPIPFARMMAFSADGTVWSTETLEGIGSPGALELAVIGDRVVAVSGPAPEGWIAGWEIDDPSWWIGTIGD